ncbi:hypothetical protein B296_00056323 [Ensete ventricosum]|uniref:RNA polymerase II subunit A C-terminal domain phosphatase SSU72 n=1 Tax=Ensete ventricosum TaxID=4639 RepID=A0A426XVW1_ENSVE|nr:hypothetical protein B296_00056323 [Ensete ventricosum]
MGAKLRYAMVCSSNQNRSMEAHALLKRHGFDVSSYGTGAHVKLPGPSLREPNVYDFGTPYKFMHDELRRKDPDLYDDASLFSLIGNALFLNRGVGCRYKRNGILPMLKRNLGVKNAPQRWQDNAADGCFDVVVTFEEKVFNIVIEGRSFLFLWYIIGMPFRVVPLNLRPQSHSPFKSDLGDFKL